MQNSVGEVQQVELGQRVTDLMIRILVVAGLAFWCFLLFQPFLMVFVWGIILAVALGPLFFRMESWLGGRRKLAGVVFILVGLAILAVPVLWLADSFFEGLHWLRIEGGEDALRVPPPPDGVADWPLVGDRVHALWSGASTSLESTLQQYGTEVRHLAAWLLAKLSGFGVAALLTMVSVVIAGVMLINAKRGGRTLHAVGARIAGARGEAAVDLAAQAIRSVAYGVVGVAALQALLSAVGLFLAGVPGAGLLSGLILLLAVAQLPPLLVLGPAIIYVFATGESTVGMVLFALWSLVVSFSDAFLKPLLLGRGLDIPMPVILIGAIGGMIRAGIIGLFVGAAVMAIGYKLYMAWMKEGESETA
ncbi:MAG: AI-2E family transporter [Planctomycetota bacterium]|jgi:predicted PurR-regulated permease PerM